MNCKREVTPIARECPWLPSIFRSPRVPPVPGFAVAIERMVVLRCSLVSSLDTVVAVGPCSSVKVCEKGTNPDSVDHGGHERGWGKGGKDSSR